MDNASFHASCIYPAVRVRTQKAGGSGTILYSQPGKGGDYDTFILTNHHVVDDAITTKEDWDSLLKRKIKKEFLELVSVELFDYVNLSTINSANTHRAEIVAYDQYHDLAVLKLQSPKRAPFTAKLIPKAMIDELRLDLPVVAVGCSLLHDPVISRGKITYLQEIIDNKKYLMTSANSIFGNSGGSMYLAETAEFIGVPSRVTTIQLGYGYDVLTWMSFCCHPVRLYEFFEEQELNFLFDLSDTYEDSLKRRERRKKAAMAEMFQAADEVSKGVGFER